MGCEEGGASEEEPTPRIMDSQDSLLGPLERGGGRRAAASGSSQRGLGYGHTEETWEGALRKEYTTGEE